jgi:hypothetical protein
LWSPEISDALEKQVPLHDRTPERRAIARIVWWRAVPLCVISVLLVAVLIPPAVGIVVEAVRIGNGEYDAVKACYLVMILLLIGLFLLSVNLLSRLIMQWRKFRD